MKDKDAYQHQGEVAGFGSADSGSEANEHRPTTADSAEERNEIDPEERNRQKRYGPTTHDDTKVTRKDGA